VIRFPILPTAGMPGSEHCDWKCWTFRLSAPPPPFFPGCGIDACWLAARLLPPGTGRS